MKKILIYFLAFFCLCQTVSANPYAALDVFEEYALTEAELLCDNLVLTTDKNSKISGKLPFIKGKDQVTIEIVSRPKYGKLTLEDTEGNFTYTPKKDFIGTDTFQFRISVGSQNSNISGCLIEVIEEGTSREKDLAFHYADMEGHWANSIASSLVNRDIIKGERIGRDYFFYPDMKIRRIDAIFYILSALDIDLSEKNYNTHIFADSQSLPEYINQAAFIANKQGFLKGTKDKELTFLNPYEYITRGELICMIDLATGEKKGKFKNPSFADDDTIPQWAYDSVKNLKSLEFIKGYPDNSLRIFDNVTKAETAHLIHTMIEYNKENASKSLSKRIKNAFYGNISV